MSKYVGMSRDEKGLDSAYESINEIQVSMMNKSILNSREKFELIGALKVAKEIVIAAKNRAYSIGAHYRSDSKQSQNEQNILIQQGVNNNDTLLA